MASAKSIAQAQLLQHRPIIIALAIIMSPQYARASDGSNEAAFDANAFNISPSDMASAPNFDFGTPTTASQNTSTPQQVSQPAKNTAAPTQVTVNETLENIGAVGTVVGHALQAVEPDLPGLGYEHAIDHGVDVISPIANQQVNAINSIAATNFGGMDADQQAAAVQSYLGGFADQ